MNNDLSKQTSVSLYHAAPGAQVLLTVLLVLSAGFSASSGFILQPFLTALSSALFAFLFMVTFKPAYVLAAIPAYALAFFLTGNFTVSLASMFFVPCGAVLALSMLKRKNKTPTVIGITVSMTLCYLVQFLIMIAILYGELSIDALRDYFNAVFETMQNTMQSTVDQAVQIAQNGQDNAYLEALKNPDTIRTALNAVKLSIPSYLVIFFEVFGYLAVSFAGMLSRIFRCEKIFPRGYGITVSKAAAVVFMICYIIYFFSPMSAPTVFSASAENLAMILSPGLFLMGLRSLKRKAKNPLRRTGFILNVIMLTVLLFISPVISFFFVVLDGIGEIFFEDRIRPV